jgi:hypothetical protein
MVSYESEVRKEAVDFIEEVMDEVKEALQNEEGYLLDGDVDDRFFECVTDRSYTLSDAAFVIENSRNVEDDSGLWQGQDPQDAIKSQAAFTFANDVRSEIEDIYEQIKSEYDDKYVEIYDKMIESAPEKVDADEDDYPEEDARDAAFKFAEEYFYDEYDPKVEVVTEKSAKINMIEKYIALGRNADLWSGYPVGSSYIDSRCGIGYGMPNIHDYVEYDHMIARAIPDICGKSEREVKDYLEGLKKEN